MLRLIYALDVAAPSPEEVIFDAFTNRPIISILMLVGALLLAAGVVTWTIIKKDKSAAAAAEKTSEKENQTKE